jgi:hypothetical protein
LQPWTRYLPTRVPLDRSIHTEFGNIVDEGRYRRDFLAIRHINMRMTTNARPPWGAFFVQGSLFSKRFTFIMHALQATDQTRIRVEFRRGKYRGLTRPAQIKLPPFRNVCTSWNWEHTLIVLIWMKPRTGPVSYST